MRSLQIIQRLIVGAAIFTALFLFQAFVHVLANDTLVTLLPGDGCGQILDYSLQGILKISLLSAYVLNALFAFSFAYSIIYKRGVALLLITAVLSVATFLAGGSINLHFHEHLNFCDIFFMGSLAPTINFATAGFLFSIVLMVLVWLSSERVKNSFDESARQ